MGIGLGIVLLVAVVGAAGGWMAWQHFSAGLPDVDGLRNYQPPVMSRVYAGDARLLAELATERRIFVPFSAIPDVVRRAFVSAEDQNFWTHAGVDPIAIARAAVTATRCRRRATTSSPCSAASASSPPRDPRSSTTSTTSKR